MDERVLIHPVNTMRPLTLEQLRGMDRPTPVWAEVEGKTIEGWDGYWCLCQNGKILAPSRLVEKAECMDGVEFYAYPPAHIDREAWEPCYACEPQLLMMGNNYCGNCGRPLTEEAWAELEKRLRG